MTTAADYPAPGSTTPVAQVDAFLATLDAWRADRGTRLVELDERVQLHGSADEREAIALAFVLWKSVGLRLDELHAARDRGRPDDCRSVADMVWTAVTDETGAVLTTDLREAVNGVEDIWSRVEQLVSLNETARRDLVTQRASIEADLTTAERLAASLGDQVRQVAELRRRFTDLAAPAPAGQTADPDEGDGRRADLAALASDGRIDHPGLGRVGRRPTPPDRVARPRRGRSRPPPRARGRGQGARRAMPSEDRLAPQPGRSVRRCARGASHRRRGPSVAGRPAPGRAVPRSGVEARPGPARGQHRGTGRHCNVGTSSAACSRPTGTRPTTRASPNGPTSMLPTRRLARSSGPRRAASTRPDDW